VNFIPAQQFIEQMANAQQIEARIIAKLYSMQEQGVVKHVCQDEWEVLDWERYNEAMGVRT
jgi:hypothetical protein